MKKQRALILNCILLAVCLGAMLLWTCFGELIFQKKADAEELAAMKETHSEAAEPFFTDLFFSGEKLPYDETTSTFYRPWIWRRKPGRAGSSRRLPGIRSFSLRRS